MHKVASIAQDAAAARVLAGAADRDVSSMRAELRGHTQVLNALRETQLEHGARLDRVEGRLDSVDGRLGSVEGRLDRVENAVNEGFAKTEHQFRKVGLGIAEITEMLRRREGGEAHPS